MTHGGTVIRPVDARRFLYAGQPTAVLGEPTPGVDSLAAAEIVIPPSFAGPVPHVHHGFDEALYVLEGVLLLTYGQADPVEAPVGAFCMAPRGVRHTFANPAGTPARVLGLWSPGVAGLGFMRDIGAVLPPGGAPDPDLVAEIYHRHASELLP
ncbi:cupin domain-containing protein [Parafrankia sp. EUN1f]|uniref:cupin domain-containing protein n=1 Tax=Parafrankia sp. EUN1f TaxID=102897 RepID=UPI0001C474ED|nr:cupin domain-containing protein [Parafrankia sp. EUN1f]EFC79678.1 Cupin 2 conserved barrel domain protein [Parafrankia sp. EUN1f]